MMELANTVPNSGGIVGFFVGENDMDLFGSQLVPFGKAMKSYSDAIAGIDAEAVTNSATAGKAIVELANTLPNTGGLVSWFTGDNDIASFGASLVSFGENFAKYSNYMKDVDAGIVTTTTNAATSIVELQKSLPKEGGWFSDDMTLASFGSDLASFGSYFSTYYGYIGNIDTGLLSSVITQTNRLVDMANGMVGLDTGGMSSFSTALTTLANSGIDNFISAFTNAEARVQSTLTTFVNSALTAIRNKYSEFNTVGTTSMTNFINGISSKEYSAKEKCSGIVSGVLSSIRNKNSEFKTVGTTLMTNFISGISSKEYSAKDKCNSILKGITTAIRNKNSEFKTVGTTLMTNFISGISSKEYSAKRESGNIARDSASSMRDYYNSFYNAGYYLVSGFADGISDNQYLAEARARAMAAAAADAARRELDEHSPSKVGYSIGDYFGVAFVNALGDYVSKSYKAGSEIAKSAKTGLSNAIGKITDFINGNVDTQPIIRPVIDLSNVQNGTNKLYRIMRNVDGYALSGSFDIANSVASSMNTQQRTGNNESVVNAINKLQNDLKTLATKPVESTDNKFYITGSNPKEIADEVSRILQKQVERREAAWE